MIVIGDDKNIKSRRWPAFMFFDVDYFKECAVLRWLELNLFPLARLQVSKGNVAH